MATEEFSHTYNSFSGADIVATFAGTIIGEVQGISYTVQREKVPLYTFGSASPRGFSRGKRGIAGSIIFLTFDRSALLDAVKDNPKYWYLANDYELTKEQRSNAQSVTGIDITEAVSSGTVGARVGEIATITLQKSWAQPRYLDQVPPFNVVINAANEYGHYAKMEIVGVEILNQGSGMSVDDITIDEACTFVAKNIKFWHDQANL